MKTIEGRKQYTDMADVNCDRRKSVSTETNRTISKEVNSPFFRV